MNPTVSIIVPFYNVENYFEEFLSSLLPINNDYEVILVNDGTKDRSRKIADKFVKQNTNVILVDKENGGLSSARNFGFNLAKGEYVVFFDSDDYIENKTVITEMLNKALESKADIVVAPYYEFYDLTNKKYRLDRHDFRDNLLDLNQRMEALFQNTASLAVWNKMYRSDFLLENNLSFVEGRWFEDLDFIFRNFYLANKISKINNILIGYRQRDGSIMHTLSLKILDKLEILKNLKLFLEEMETYEHFKDGFKAIYFRMAFSILFNAVQNTNDQKVSKEIIHVVFNDINFQLFLKEGIANKKYMSSSEKLFFILLRNKVVNERNIFYLKTVSKLRS